MSDGDVNATLENGAAYGVTDAIQSEYLERLNMKTMWWTCARKKD